MGDRSATLNGPRLTAPRPASHGYARALVAAPLLATGIMGLLKLTDLPQFAGAVRAWTLLPRPLVPVVTVAVPLVEVGLAGAWLAHLGRRRCEGGLLLLILLYSAVYIGQLTGGTAPPCGCLGVLAARFRDLERAELVLARNFLFAGALVIGMALSNERPPPTGTSARRGRCPDRNRSAFTLVETILVVALVALLVGFTLPSLAKVRYSARLATTRSNLRQHGTILAAYNSDYKDLYPYLTDPRATKSVIRCQSAGFAVTVLYFQGADWWWLGLADGYYNGSWRSPAFRSPLAPPEFVVGSYTMPCSFIADPAYYTPETREPPPKQLRAVRSSEVELPSHKSLLVDNSVLFNFEALGLDADEVQACMADGHSSGFDRARTGLLQHHTGDGPYPDFGAHFPSLIPMTHTHAGVRGRDDR